MDEQQNEGETTTTKIKKRKQTIFYGFIGCVCVCDKCALRVYIQQSERDNDIHFSV